MSDGLVAVLGRGILAIDEPVIRADDLGFMRGDGCFETCRAVIVDPAKVPIDNLDAHLNRLSRSARILGIDIDLAACADLMNQVVASWATQADSGEISIRLSVTRGVHVDGPPTVVAVVKPISALSVAQRTTGIRVVTLARGTGAYAFDEGDWLLGGVKALSYALNMAALREAERRGADDAIWTSVEGQVLESPTSTVLWLDGSMLKTTPTGATGILAGTTLAAVFDGMDDNGLTTAVAELNAEQLKHVDGLWLLSSVRGPVAVTELDGAPVPVRHELTEQLQKLTGF